MVAVKEDGLGTQSSLHTGRVLKHDESKVGNWQSVTSYVSALPLVDPRLQHSTKLGEEIGQILLCTAMRQVPHKQPLIVATLDYVLLLAEPFWPLTSLRSLSSKTLTAASLVTSC